MSGRARTNSKSPRAHGICDRCGFRYNFEDLAWQFDWRGAALQNLRILVCDRCKDVPDEQLRAIVLPRDPDPIINARVEWYTQDEGANFPVASGQTDPTTGLPILNFGTTIVSGTKTITYQEVGNPTGYTTLAQMPLVAGQTWGNQLSVTSMTTSAGLATISVTCSAAHGLSTGSQVGVIGVLSTIPNASHSSVPIYASGIFSVTVTTGTAFYYTMAATAPTTAGIMTGTTQVRVVNMGLPYDANGIVPEITPTQTEF